MREFEQKKIGSHFSTPFFGPKIQKKLTTGTVGDRYETEADNVADKVVNKRKGGGLLQSRTEEGVQQKPISETISTVQKQDLAQEQPLQKKGKEKEEDKKVQKKSDKEEDKKTVQKKGEKEEDKKVQKKSDKEEDKKVQKKGEKEEDKQVQKKCADCEGEDKKVQKKGEKEEDKKPVQAKLKESSPDNEGIENDLNRSKGSGSTMDKNTKQEMESGFGTDFSSVNIHTDSKAVQMSEQLGAQAFTHGSDVYFNKGKYKPDSKEGKHLLAHELTHTIQQTGSKTPNNVQKLSDPDCGSTKHLKLSGSCYDFHNTCYTETFVPSKSDALKIVIDVDYMEPVGSWIKEDFSAQVIKCGLIDDTNIGSKRISLENIPSTLEFNIASVTPGDKYFIRIYSRSSSALKSNYSVSQ
ncbi:eCIS core domain-containing protein [Flavobacterium aquicola]|uniref:Uncharacterized protein DUF4157 n=1 Tax=Flavobacterium aquicola TaxID=1682742 RepID=A0A3E0ELJ6_9FLAO|nr:DUF4157 domain-containing protein [Flavobacterium aquicola]REG99097.1 uncharacterized protein DUF4157 [Flavobacterium aquicola]